MERRDVPAEPRGGVSDLDASQRAAFTAFQRAQKPEDTAICRDERALARLGVAQAGNDVNPSLARRVLARSEGNVFLVPGRGAVCLLCLLLDDEAIMGTTNTELAAEGGHGFISHRPLQQQIRFLGVLPRGGHSPTITRANGETEALATNVDDGYWLATSDDVIAFSWIRSDGTTRHVPFSGSSKLR
jgi:hypothetical protein